MNLKESEIPLFLQETYFIMIKVNGFSILDIGDNLYHNEEHRFYSAFVDSEIKDTYVWQLVMKYADIICKNENRNILIKASKLSVDGYSAISFFVENISQEEEILIKELYSTETEEGFCIASFKDTPFLITIKGDVISGNEIIDKVLSERIEEDKFSLKGMKLSTMFFHGLVEYAITTELFLRPMREHMKGDRVQVKDQKTYLLLDKENMLVKIGRSANVMERIKQLSISNENLILIAYCKRGELETVLHHLYKQNKKSREWYELTMQDIEWTIKEFKMTVSHKKWKNFFKK